MPYAGFPCPLILILILGGLQWLVIPGSSQNCRAIGFGNRVDHFKIRFLVLAIEWARELKSPRATQHLETLDVIGEAFLNPWLNSEENKRNVYAPKHWRRNWIPDNEQVGRWAPGVGEDVRGLAIHGLGDNAPRGSREEGGNLLTDGSWNFNFCIKPGLSKFYTSIKGGLYLNSTSWPVVWYLALWSWGSYNPA